MMNASEVDGVRMDFRVRIDRSIQPRYPSWMRRLAYPELQRVGPNDYDLRFRVGQWLHESQKSVVVPGSFIYKKLREENLLIDQLSFADLMVIQTKGVAVFTTLYAGKTVFAWKSVAVTRDNLAKLRVPGLCLSGDALKIFWFFLDCGLSPNEPALHFLN